MERLWDSQKEMMEGMDGESPSQQRAPAVRSDPGSGDVGIFLF